MGPDEWMLVRRAGEAADRARTTRDALAGMHHQLVDVSDYYTVDRGSGTESADAADEADDTGPSPARIQPGMVAGSVFGRANALDLAGARASRRGGASVPALHPLVDGGLSLVPRSPTPAANGACRSRFR